MQPKDPGIISIGILYLAWDQLTVNSSCTIYSSSHWPLLVCITFIILQSDAVANLFPALSLSVFICYYQNLKSIFRKKKRCQFGGHFFIKKLYFTPELHKMQPLSSISKNILGSSGPYYPIGKVGMCLRPPPKQLAPNNQKKFNKLKKTLTKQSMVTSSISIYR